ncbi:MAG: DMT family transporter [Pseudomonadota bacterium]
MNNTTNRTVPGIALMVVSMASFSLADTLVKFASASLSAAQILFYLNAGGLAFFFAFALFQREQLIHSGAFKPVMLVRYVSEVLGMVGMILALKYVALSTVGAITQAAPLLVALGAVAFLGEKISWRRWSSIAVGFTGVLMIVQPGGAGFELSVLWAVLAMLALAVRDLTTRMIPEGMGSGTLASYSMLATAPFALAWVFYNGDSLFPATARWTVVLPMVMLGSLGYMLLTFSIRMAEVSVVTPFRYTRILFLLVLGVVVFEEKPNALMLCGAALVIASGVYLMAREQRVKRKAQAASSGKG